MTRITNKEMLKKFLEIELKFYKCNSITYLLGIGEIAILRKHCILLRKTEYYKNRQKKILYYIYLMRLLKLQNKYSLHIPINVCDMGLRIMHLGPILINGNSKIGKNVAIHINTGVVAGGITGKCPRIDDGVVIGIGSVVLGDIYIAKNVAIGANSVVNSDVVEENIAVAGVPARKISNNGRLQWNKK